MNHNKLFAVSLLSFSIIILFACKSNANSSNNTTDSTKNVTSVANSQQSDQFTATVDGKSYVGKLNHATQTLNYGNSGNNVFTIESFASSNASEAATTQHFVLLIHFSGKVFEAGTYNFEVMELSNPFSSNHGTFSDGMNRYNFNPAKGGNGSITITNIDESKGLVSGTFSGTAVNNSEKIEIKDGKFNNLSIISGN